MSMLAVAFASGLIFALGLVLGDMTDPARVIGFLDVAGQWDATLLYVMLSAVITTTLGYRYVARRDRPILTDQFALPTSQVIDSRLIVGSALFGVGWGLAGFCPGPAVAVFSLLNAKAVIFLISMLAGMGLYSAVSSRVQQTPPNIP